MRTAIYFQPYSNFTIYKTAEGRYSIEQNAGKNAVFGQASIEAAIRMAKANFGMLMVEA